MTLPLHGGSVPASPGGDVRGVRVRSPPRFLHSRGEQGGVWRPVTAATGPSELTQVRGRPVASGPAGSEVHGHPFLETVFRRPVGAVRRRDGAEPALAGAGHPPAWRVRGQPANQLREAFDKLVIYRRGRYVHGVVRIGHLPVEDHVLGAVLMALGTAYM